MSLPKSFFVSETVFERKVTLGDDEGHVLYFRELPHTEFRRFFDAERSEDEDIRAQAAAKLIAASLCDADGKPALTFKDAIRLKPTVAGAISEAILDINGLKKGKALPPDQMNGSGTSSHSPSEDAPSENSSLQ